jgi:hypothetical protein
MKEEDDVMWFTAIIAPSGTGKTQLAATAAQVDPENTRYIHCSPANEIDLQPFYKPHTAVSRVLFKLLEKFAGSELATVSGQLVGANGLRTAFCTDKGETGTDVLANFLDKLLFGGEACETAMSFYDLMDKIKLQCDPFLVFLDETPALGSDAYDRVILFAMSCVPLAFAQY